MNPHSLPRDIWPIRECTSREYLTHGARVTTIPQLRIAARAVDYGCSAVRLASGSGTYGDYVRARDYGRMAATLAKLAFVDLEETI